MGIGILNILLDILIFKEISFLFTGIYCLYWLVDSVCADGYIYSNKSSLQMVVFMTAFSRASYHSSIFICLQILIKFSPECSAIQEFCFLINLSLDVCFPLILSLFINSIC